jgi:hypothetical protein
MPKRKRIDWERIEAEYRTNTFSTRALAAKYGCTETAIRHRAKQYGWSKDLTESVRKETNARLLRTEVRAPRDLRKDSEIIAEAADLRVTLLTSHRRDLEQLHALKRIIATRLAAHLNGDPIEGPYTADKESPGDLVEKLSRVTARLIPLERQAHNLDEAPPAAMVSASVTVASMTPERFEEVARKVADEF